MKINPIYINLRNIETEFKSPRNIKVAKNKCFNQNRILAREGKIFPGFIPCGRMDQLLLPNIFSASSYVTAWGFKALRSHDFTAGPFPTSWIALPPSCFSLRHPHIALGIWLVYLFNLNSITWTCILHGFISFQRSRMWLRTLPNNHQILGNLWPISDHITFLQLLSFNYGAISLGL